MRDQQGSTESTNTIRGAFAPQKAFSFGWGCNSGPKGTWVWIHIHVEANDDTPMSTKQAAPVLVRWKILIYGVQFR